MTVRLLLEEKQNIDVVSKELGIHSNTLRRWIKEYETNGDKENSLQGNALLCYLYEIKKLEREIAD